jgi:hypothetical protein
MIYTPRKNPKQAAILITVVVFAGIIGGIYLHKLFMVAALIFWMQYTAVLSYLQFKRKSKHKWNSFTEIILHPQIRFFLFEFLAFVGLWAVLIYDWLQIGGIALLGWLGFSINFYFYYKEFKKYE